MFSQFLRGWVALVSALAVLNVGAQAMPADPKAVFEAAKLVAKDGPASVLLTNQASLNVPAGYTFIPQPNAGALLNAMGNPGTNENLQGLVFPKGEGEWFMTVRFESAGYIKDDDAKDWNAEELLSSIKKGTEAANASRKKMGAPEIEIIGWAEKPAYDAATHRLVWAMSAKDRGAAATAPQGVNYNTYALGREGYFSLNLVTDLKDLEAQKPIAKTMLSALEFNQGKRYADFNASTDRVAEYGLAALVAGAAAKKLGLLAIVLAFFAKFAKLILLGLAVFGAGIVKFLRRDKD
jgi:uncharacterized membrane-anchored protein